MNEDDLMEEQEQEETGTLFLEWVVTAFLAGVLIYLIIKFLFF